MAWKDVDPGTEEPRVAGEFVRLNAIGDKLIGWFVGVSETPSKFQNKDGTPKMQTNYTVRAKDGVNKILTGNYDLNRHMTKAFADGLKKGHQVVITHSHTVPSDKPGYSDMKAFKVKFNPEPEVKMPEAKAAAPAPAGDDDFS